MEQQETPTERKATPTPLETAIQRQISHYRSQAEGAQRMASRAPSAAGDVAAVWFYVVDTLTAALESNRVESESPRAVAAARALVKLSMRTGSPVEPWISSVAYAARDMTWASTSASAADPRIFLQPGERLHVSELPGTPDDVQLIVTDVLPPDPTVGRLTYTISTRAVTEADG